ncbi:polysaccharide biosynthesis tyrosine autokinase [Microlunatus sp. GCM10028923]|uniref:polysaccharide biosynthesis tyrosine autokinase n=1 Tax=Microlunatus sp. GCM10028923 TaxID=3273400 RepID=UPI0036148CEE
MNRGMDLRSYLSALRKNWWLVLVITACCTAIAVAALLLTPNTYASKVTFYVSTPISDGSNPQSSGQFAVTRVNSYVELLSSDKLAEEVAKDVGFDAPPGSHEDMITGSAELNTVLVTATISDADPARAFAIAQAVSDKFPEMVDELDNKGKSGSAVVVLTTVSGPTPPLVVAPSGRIYGAIGIGGGLLLGVLAALFRELLNTSIRSGETLSEVLGAPALGTINFDPTTKRLPLIIGEQAASARSEAYRHLRTSLQFVDAAAATQVLLITSAVPNEGKTTTSVNLALSFVEFGDRVLLISADLRRPRLGSLLTLSESNGLTGLLVGQTQLNDAIQQWGNSQLFYIGSGSLPPNPSELLGGERMAELMERLRGRFDKIIVDAPPLLPVTDAAVASALVDGVVVVVRDGHTNRTQLTATRKTLDGVGARIIGGVLNMRKSSKREQRTYGGDSYQVATFQARRSAGLSSASPAGFDEEEPTPARSADTAERPAAPPQPPQPPVVPPTPAPEPTPQPTPQPAPRPSRAQRPTMITNLDAFDQNDTIEQPDLVHRLRQVSDRRPAEAPFPAPESSPPADPEEPDDDAETAETVVIDGAEEDPDPTLSPATPPLHSREG